MLVNWLRNISESNINVVLKGGILVTLPKGQEIIGQDVQNLHELGGSVSYNADLSEIKQTPELRKIYG